MLWFLIAYLACGLAATLLYVSLAHRLDVPPDQDTEAEWWSTFAQARRQLGHDPSHAEVLYLLQKTTAKRRAA